MFMNKCVCFSQDTSDTVTLKSIKKLDEDEVVSSPASSTPRTSISSVSLKNNPLASSSPLDSPVCSYSNGLREHDAEWMLKECSLAEMLRGDPAMPPVARSTAHKMQTQLVPEVTDVETAFQAAKEQFKDKCFKVFNGLLFSDYPLPNATHSCAKLGCTREVL